MGQYYNAVVELNGNKEVYYHYVDGDYMAAKLTEHSYWRNPFVLAIASKFWRTKGRLAWVGDYAEPEDFNWNEAFEDAHTENVERKDLVYNGFCLEGKYFINHSKKQLIDLDEYKNLLKDIDMIISPVSLLTAVGNNKGSGDFHSGTGYELVGTWAWDEIEITDQAVYDWKYNAEKEDWDKFLKKEFSDYTDVTTEYLFIEKSNEKHMESGINIEEALAKRQTTHYGIYHDVGEVLKDFSTNEIVEFFVSLGLENCLRYYMEQQITAREIEKSRSSDWVKLQACLTS